MMIHHERSAGVIPYKVVQGGEVEFLVLHSALVRNPRAKWEFPKGSIEDEETPFQTACREFEEETGITQWRKLDGFERTLSYTYIRRGKKVLKTVSYYIFEILDDSTMVCSSEHVEDIFGHWFHWGSFNQIHRLLFHAKIRQLFVLAHETIRKHELSRSAQAPPPMST